MCIRDRTWWPRRSCRSTPGTVCWPCPRPLAPTRSCTTTSCRCTRWTSPRWPRPCTRRLPCRRISGGSGGPPPRSRSVATTSSPGSPPSWPTWPPSEARPGHRCRPANRGPVLPPPPGTWAGRPVGPARAGRGRAAGESEPAARPSSAGERRRNCGSFGQTGPGTGSVVSPDPVVYGPGRAALPAALDHPLTPSDRVLVEVARLVTKRHGVVLELRPAGERGILGEGCRDCYRPVRRRSQSSTVARVDASAVPRRRCSRRCAMDRRYSGMANDGRSRPPPATRMWWANPRSRVVIGTTMTSPTGQALNALVEITRTGRVPLCSPGPAGSRDASQTSPRSGIQTLDRCFLPLATLGEVVAPCLGVHLAQLAHLSGGLLHQCRVLYLARQLIEQCTHRDAANLSGGGEAVPHLDGYLDGGQVGHPRKVPHQGVHSEGRMSATGAGRCLDVQLGPDRGHQPVVGPADRAGRTHHPLVDQTHQQVAFPLPSLGHLARGGAGGLGTSAAARPHNRVP